MKKVILLAAIVIVAGAAMGQTFQKGNLVGNHVGTIMLDPDVTYNQYKDFVINKYIPVFEKQFKGEMKLYFAEGDRGDDVNGVSFLIVCKSVEARDKYFSQDGEETELFKSKFEKIQPIFDELNKMGTFNRKHYTDWVIQ